MIFVKTLQKMLERYLILQIINWIDHFLKEKKVIELMKGKLGRKIMAKFVGLIAETYSNLIDVDGEDKKARSTKKCVIKRKLKFENNYNCLQATLLENKKPCRKKLKKEKKT